MIWWTRAKLSIFRLTCRSWGRSHLFAQDNMYISKKWVQSVKLKGRLIYCAWIKQYFRRKKTSTSNQFEILGDFSTSLDLSMRVFYVFSYFLCANGAMTWPGQNTECKLCHAKGLLYHKRIVVFTADQPAYGIWWMLLSGSRSFASVQFLIKKNFIYLLEYYS